MSQFKASIIAVAGLATLISALPAKADNDRSIALILDASGSMQAKLASGERRINAAKDAIERFTSATAGGTRLSLWVYGHQSHRSKKNCKDIQQLTNYQALGSNRAKVIESARGLTAQGYTPISDILEQAANDLKSESSAKSRAVILVSDGKETCEGDPCAVAKALAEADASLVVHTIGFAVDVAARYELQCIAKHARGKYFEAADVDKLTKSLSSATKSAAVKAPPPIKVEAKKPGALKLANTSGSYDDIYDSTTNAEVGSLGPVSPVVSLPAGIYKVQFGNAYWRGIELVDGKTTTIDTAILSLPTASFRGHKILDWETDEEIGKLSSQKKSVNLMPSSFKLMFGSMALKVELKPGEMTEVQAGSVAFKGLPVNCRSIFNAAGEEVLSVSNSGAGATFLPGSYELEHNDKRYPFTITNGEAVVVNLK